MSEYNGDKCPKCARLFIVPTPIPKEQEVKVTCVSCGHEAPLIDFVRAYDNQWEIDHIDGDPCNNDPANLRLVTPSESFGTARSPRR